MKHFLSLADLSSEQLRGLLDLAIHLKEQWKAGGNPPLLRNKTLGMVFPKPSLRTRVSFDMAMIQLGGQADIGPADLVQDHQAAGAGSQENGLGALEFAALDQLCLQSCCPSAIVAHCLKARHVSPALP